MVLRTENFNIFGVHWKIQLLGGGLEKPIYRGGAGLPKKGGTGTACWFKEGGGLGKKEGRGVFERGWDPNAHYDTNA